MSQNHPMYPKFSSLQKRAICYLGGLTGPASITEFPKFVSMRAVAVLAARGMVTVSIRLTPQGEAEAARLKEKAV